jgi:hypothetical protein
VTLSQRLVNLEKVLKLHEDAEDLTIFPALEDRFRHIAETYAYDHKRHRRHSDALAMTLNDLATARGSRRRDLIKTLGEQSVAFNGFMNLHIDKENELLFPTYDQTFSPEEQGEHGKGAEGHVDPQAMAAAGIWTFQRLQADDREAFLRFMMGMFPPEAFAGFSKGMSAAVPAADWQEMARRIPEMAS